MESNLSDSILHVCTIFNKHNIQYMIVGGAAVALHGYFRHSVNMAGIITDKPDLDFWYNPTYVNYFKLISALEELGQNVLKFKQEKAPNPRKSFFRYEFEQFTLDLLPVIKAPLKFNASFQSKETVTLYDIDIPFINYHDLILDKQVSARAKDIKDIQNLKQQLDS